MKDEDIKALRESHAELLAALEPFVSSASHTLVFLQSMEKMHPYGIDLFRNDVGKADRALTRARAIRERFDGS